jgi:purine-binding chemotaxis protein CheW
MKTLNLLIFKIADEDFVIEIDNLIQIIRYIKPTPIPKTPPFIEGIIVLRNMVIPVINLRKKLYGEVEEKAKKPKIFIAKINDLTLGFKVDDLHKILSVEEDKILPPPPAIEGMSVEYIKGIVEMEKNVYLYLDLPKTISKEEIDILKNIKKEEKRK